MKIDRLAELKGGQAAASSPDADIWLSASAGTGKTYVLAARVWRLLLRGCRPDAILCLTFTRAGAAEMAERVHRRLASWARLDDLSLGRELFALGEPRTSEDIARARTLFARVLESRGGGLRVMTIHAFCQTLLATFPLEAGLAPGFRAIEGREQAALAGQVLADLATTAEQERNERLVAALRALSLRLGEGATREFLLRAASRLDALEMLTDGIDAKVRRALAVPADFDATHIPARCCDDQIERTALLDLARMHVEWGTKTGEGAADAVSNWLLGTPEQRAAELGSLSAIWMTQSGTLRQGGPKDAGYAALVERLHGWCSELKDLAARAELASDIVHALYAARAYARAYADAKRANGFVDFDDLIQKAVALLTTPGIGAWIGYKLDQATEHVLVDEAQDTNVAQWEIVKALVGEFWAEDTAVDGRLRTLFTVGDDKQAIFGFQGTDPRHYQKAHDTFSVDAAHARRTLANLSLAQSFRSAQPVLDVVDAVIQDLGHEAMGIRTAEPHVSAIRGPGKVMLLPPLRAPEREDLDDGEETWVPTATRMLASQIARQVRDWLSGPKPLQMKNGPLTPGGVMILVRRRGDLAALLVARLLKEGVTVAGVDRLRLAAPLVVKDCLAALRFALQPDDDLNLASLLVSPILGWTQDQLYELAHRPRKSSLWRELRDTADTAATVMLRDLLNMADYVSPHVFLETMLSGAIGARKRLLTRLGNEATDAIDELLNAALDFEREGVATLQGFVEWFDRGEGEIVRDPGGRPDAVRVMTVHAAKGLEASLVILADATSDPDAAPDRDFSWVLDEAIHPLPLFRPREAERQLVQSLQDAAMVSDELSKRENWRLLYVAMTRAAEQLVVAGALNVRQPNAPGSSWYAAIQHAMKRLGATHIDDMLWGETLSYGDAPQRGGEAKRAAVRVEAPSRPVWLDSAAPIEAQPSRPLAPSLLGRDRVADPPPTREAHAAAARGRVLHALFERLVDVAPAKRRDAGLTWLAMAGGVDDPKMRDDLMAAVIGILDDPTFADVFGAGGLAEVPIAGVVEGVVISGTVDRLVVREDAVDLIDFKTSRRVPGTGAQVPDTHKRQMAAYAAVLRSVFPEKRVRALLLYTAGPVLIALNDADLDAHKPRLAVAE